MNPVSDVRLAAAKARMPRRYKASTPLATALALVLGVPTLSADAAPTASSLMALNAGIFGEQHPAAAMRARFLRNNGALPTPAQRAATTTVVANCNDSGPGSLREAVVSAASGDTIDLSGLSCGTITLTSGALVSGVDYLTLNGPGADKLAIDAGNNSRVIALLGGYGILGVNDITLRNGFYTDPNDPDNQASGGCVLAAQYVTISGSTLDHCQATGKRVTGGAVRAGGAMRLINSVVTGTTASAEANDISATVEGGVLYGGAVYLTNSTVSDANVTAHTTTSYGGVFGGGVFGLYGMILTDSTVTGVKVHVSAARDTYAKGGGVGSPTTVILERTTIANNAVHGTPGAGLYNGGTYNSAIGGGGVYIMSIPRSHPVQSTVSDSTISGNSAICDGSAGNYTHGGGGGLGTWAIYPVIVSNSTISGNWTNLNGGGLYTRNGGTLSLANATVTDNSADNGAGIADLGTRASVLLASESSIVAGNHALAAVVSTQIVTVHDGIDGTHNLITDANVALPADTVTADPQLAPLADNGGATRTHALLPGSPAIDAGSNLSGATWDQRGSGFLRVFGTAADIGAYETQPVGEVIFANGFE